MGVKTEVAVEHRQPVKNNPESEERKPASARPFICFHHVMA
jgi:hypothetical protein